MKKAQVVEILKNANISTDHITAHKDGSFTFKQSFFYTHGASAQQWAEKIKQSIQNIDIIESYDSWKNWPATSYFVVKFVVNE